MSENKQAIEQHLEESLSALMDGEATELEIRRLMKSCDADEALMQKWHRYQMASASMKGDVVLSSPLDLSQSISQAIAEEPAYKVSEKSSKSRIWGNLGRFGIAASVAGAVVMGVQFASVGTSVNQVVDNTAPVITPPSDPQFGNDASISVVSQETSPKAVSPQRPSIILTDETQEQLKGAESELGRLMLEHAQNAAQNTQHGVLPYIRVPETEN